MKKVKKMTKTELKKRLSAINKVEKKFREIEAILSEVGADEVGVFISSLIKTDKTNFEGVSMLLGAGKNIIHSLQNSFKQNEAFADLAKEALESCDENCEECSIGDFVEAMFGKITDDFKQHMKDVDKEKDMASKN